MVAGVFELQTAIRLANAALAERRYETTAVVSAHCETTRSFLFCTRAITGEVLYGAPIVAVDKATGEVRDAPEAFYEFFTDQQLNLLQRLVRCWQRHTY